MIALLAWPEDEHAVRFEALHAKDGVRRILPRDVSTRGWVLRVADGDRDDSSFAVQGERFPASALRGCITRLSAIRDLDLLHIAAEDRAYVAAEMTAFLLAWLTQLPCPVVNPPTPQSLAAGHWSTERWIALAARAGAPVRPFKLELGRQHQLPSGAQVSVVGERAIGDVAPELRAHAVRVARTAGTPLLIVIFEHAGADARVIGAHTWIDLSDPAIAAAVLELFPERTRQ